PGPRFEFAGPFGRGEPLYVNELAHIVGFDSVLESQGAALRQLRRLEGHKVQDTQLSSSRETIAEKRHSPDLVTVGCPHQSQRQQARRLDKTLTAPPSLHQHCFQFGFESIWWTSHHARDAEKELRLLGTDGGGELATDPSVLACQLHVPASA